MTPTIKILFFCAICLDFLFIGGWVSSSVGEVTCIYSSKISVVASDKPAFAVLETEAGVWKFGVGIGSHLQGEFSFYEFSPNSKRGSASWYTPADNDSFGTPFPYPSISNILLGTFGVSFDRKFAMTVPFWLPVILLTGLVAYLGWFAPRIAEQADAGTPVSQ